MEKKTGIILGIVASIVIILCFFTVNVDKEETKKSIKGATTSEDIMYNAKLEASSISDDERVKLTDIEIDEYLNFYSDDSEKVVFVGSEGCPYCALARPIIENIVYEYNINVYYLNYSNFTAEDEDKFIGSDEFFNSNTGVPILLYVGNGEIIDVVDGLSDTEHYMKFFEDNGIIKG